MMIRRFIYMVCPILLVLFFLSCSSTPDIVITEKNTNKVVEVKKEEIFAVKLSARLSLGLSWRLASKLTKIEEVCKPKVVTEEKLKTGGVDYQVFTFKALTEGKEKLQFEYIEAISSSKKVEKQYNVTVKITEEK